MPQPGDFAVVDCPSQVGTLIDLAEWLSGGGMTMFNHALICTGITADGTVMVVEAEPGGAVERAWHYDGCAHAWSSMQLTSAQRAALVKAAQGYAGTPYSFLDYLAIAARRFLGPWLSAPLRNYVAGTGHMICSQLVARCYFDAKVPLWPEWTGYCRPSDLAALVLSE